MAVLAISMAGIFTSAVVTILLVASIAVTVVVSNRPSTEPISNLNDTVAEAVFTDCVSDAKAKNPEPPEKVFEMNERTHTFVVDTRHCRAFAPPHILPAPDPKTDSRNKSEAELALKDLLEQMNRLDAEITEVFNELAAAAHFNQFSEERKEPCFLLSCESVNDLIEAFADPAHPVNQDGYYDQARDISLAYLECVDRLRGLAEPLGEETRRTDLFEVHDLCGSYAEAAGQGILLPLPQR